MKVTERALVELCRRINSVQLKGWDSGLKVERRGGEYIVLRQFRKPQEGRSRTIDLFLGHPREVNAFIEGFASGSGLANNCAVCGAES